LAVVTAGAKRLGRALSIRLAELGYDIAVHHNSSVKEAEETAAHIRSLGRRSETFHADFTKQAEVRALIPGIVERLGPPSVLINNASVFIANTLESTSEEHFDLDFAVHVKAPLFLIKDFVSAGGPPAIGNTTRHIINIVDTAITRTSSDYFSYLLSKKALYELSRMAARDLAPDIRVNAIAPGIIIPPAGIEEEKYKRLAGGNLLKRIAGPDDILIALEYLLRNQQVTGDCLFVDGGDHVYQ
jgi:NAD(P)-dependent dehydrogenase (short-subunit alcohol dehydrogenase family)